MPFDSERHHRHSARLRDYDYRQEGAYAVTVCAYQREDLFGEVVEGAMRLNTIGRIVEDEWFHTAILRPEIELDTYVVMPNHFHGILVITQTAVGAQRATPAQSKLHIDAGSLGAIVRGFKSAVTQRVNVVRDTPGSPVWQRSFYDQLIRSEAMLASLREYILLNPARWSDDQENTERRR